MPGSEHGAQVQGAASGRALPEKRRLTWTWMRRPRPPRSSPLWTPGAARTAACPLLVRLVFCTFTQKLLLPVLLHVLPKLPCPAKVYTRQDANTQLRMLHTSDSAARARLHWPVLH